MDKTELKKISAVVSKRLGRKIFFVSAEALKGGFQADAYKIISDDGKAFFLKKMKRSGEAGFEMPERHLLSFKVSHGMTKRSGLKPEPIGVIIARGEETVILPELDEEASLYHVQEFADGLGENFWDSLVARKEKKTVDEKDRKEIRAITEILVSIHNTTRPDFSQAVLKSLYNDSLQSILAHPGYFFRFLSDFGPKHPFLPRSKHGKFVELILFVIYKFENDFERLKVLHGDFWGTNIFYQPDGKVSVVDFSRIPYGEPGIDVGYFTAQFLWFYHDTGNKYFKNLGELFIHNYENQTGDRKIRQSLCLPLGLLTLLYCNQRFHPDNNSASEKSFFNAVVASLKKGKFSWGKSKR